MTGEVKEMEMGVIEVASSLNYLDETGPVPVWRETREIMEILSSGQASATRGPHTLRCQPDLSSDEAIVISKGDKVFFTRPLGIFYFDPQTDQSVELAKVNPEAVAEVLPPNQIVWKAAFLSPSVRADFRLTYARMGIEADVIFTHNPLPPDKCLPAPDPNRTQLQVRHAFAVAPIPVIRSREVQPGLIDEVLHFGSGDLWFPTGSAFSSNGGTPRNRDEPAKINLPWLPDGPGFLPVCKKWRISGQGATLTESVLWKDASAELAKLPELESSATQSSATDIGPKSIQTASTPYAPNGFVLDYITISSGASITFDTYNGFNNTYYVKTAASFLSVVFNAGCVVKYAPGAYVQISRTPTCNGTPQSPSVLTSRDDPLFGETTGLNPEGYTGCPSYAADKALWFYSEGGNGDISGMRIRYATTGYRIDSENYCPVTHYINSTVIESCQYGVYAVANSLCFPGYNLSYCREVTVPTYACVVNGELIPQVPLLKHVATYTQALMNGHNVPADLSLYTTTGNPDYLVTGHNPNCWLNGYYGYTSLSVSNPGPDSPPDHAWWQGPATLVTPHFAVAAAHMGPYLNREFRWIGSDGQHYLATCVGEAAIDSGWCGTWSDARILRMSVALPGVVHRAKVIPAAVRNKAPFLTKYWLPESCTANLLPCITAHGSLPNTSFAYDWYFAATCWPNAEYRQDQWLPAAFGGIAGDGDSGHPVWVLINNELALVSTLFNVAVSEPWYGGDTNAVNATIQSLSGGLTPPYEKVTPVDLSSFPDL